MFDGSFIMFIIYLDLFYQFSRCYESIKKYYKMRSFHNHKKLPRDITMFQSYKDR